MEELLTLPGVGRKTANLVLILSHASRDNICVDTHVHRIANRLGWVRTQTPEQTEQALYRDSPAEVVAGREPVSGDLGPERLPAGLSAMSRLCRLVVVPASWRDEDIQRVTAQRCARYNGTAHAPQMTTTTTMGRRNCGMVADVARPGDSRA